MRLAVHDEGNDHKLVWEARRLLAGRMGITEVKSGALRRKASINKLLSRDNGTVVPCCAPCCERVEEVVQGWGTCTRDLPKHFGHNSKS